MQPSYARSFTYTGSLMETSYASRMRKPAEVMLVPMIDIFTVLVTFLLMTAVFSRITILQLDLPSSTAAGPTPPPAFRLEVIVRDSGFELTNGTKTIAAIAKVAGKYDFGTLTEMALSLKREYPEAADASVLLEREIAYDHLIQVMDAIRSTKVERSSETGGVEMALAQTDPQPATAAAQRRYTKVELFPNIAVGEAP